MKHSLKILKDQQRQKLGIQEDFQKTLHSLYCGFKKKKHQDTFIIIHSDYCSYVKIEGCFSFRYLGLHTLRYMSKMTLISSLLQHTKILCKMQFHHPGQGQELHASKENVIAQHNTQTFKFFFQLFI